VPRLQKIHKVSDITVVKLIFSNRVLMELAINTVFIIWKLS